MHATCLLVAVAPEVLIFIEQAIVHNKANANTSIGVCIFVVGHCLGGQLDRFRNSLKRGGGGQGLTNHTYGLSYCHDGLVATQSLRTVLMTSLQPPANRASLSCSSPGLSLTISRRVAMPYPHDVFSLHCVLRPCHRNILALPCLVLPHETNSLCCRTA